MKKLIALCLCLVLSVLPAFALKGSGVESPDDLPYIPTEQSPSGWAVEEIRSHRRRTGARSAGRSLLSGGGHLEQFAALAVTLAEKATGKTLPAAPADTFTDTQSEVVRKAYQAGIVNGMGDGTFAPQQTTNREQIATMLLRAILYIQDQNKTDYIEQFEDLSLYQDAGQVSSWATQAMGILAHNGIFKGVGGNNIAPSRAAPWSRASCCATVCIKRPRPRARALMIKENRKGESIYAEV